MLRRVYLDLIGLPPTPAEMNAFLADNSKDAYEKVVDKLLASPRYGERWGRHWMDIWRYSDWYGWRAQNQVRYSQRHIWHWRDWIIESVNKDKGYDEMIVEMLAGDELAPNNPDVTRATGLSREELVHVRPQRLAQGHGRLHRHGVSRPDRQMRPLPFAQVRPDHARGLLPLPGFL